MTPQEARNIVGDRADWELRLMNDALSGLQFLNTGAENERLEAVKVLLNSRERR